MNNEQDKLVDLIDKIILGGQLSDLEEKIFRLAHDRLTYVEVAEKLGYNIDHVKRIGAKLWQKLSDKIGERVCKTNFQRALIRYAKEQNLIEALIHKPESED
jgi:hypothetical protein